jgi:hypothetical protein
MKTNTRDDNFTRAARYPIRQVQARVPFFIYGSDPHLSHESVGAGTDFIFHPWVICGYIKFQILMVLT